MAKCNQLTALSFKGLTNTGVRRNQLAAGVNTDHLTMQPFINLRLAPSGRPPTDQQSKPGWTRNGPKRQLLSVAVVTPLQRGDVSDVDKSVTQHERSSNHGHPPRYNCDPDGTWSQPEAGHRGQCPRSPR